MTIAGDIHLAQQQQNQWRLGVSCLPRVMGLVFGWEQHASPRLLHLKFIILADAGKIKYFNGFIAEK